VKTLTTIFDTRHRGFTYDCIYFYVMADVIREMNGLEALDVRIYANAFRKKTEREHIYDDEEKLWRVHNVISKVPFLLPAVKSVTFSNRLPDYVPVNVFPPGYHPYYPSSNAMVVNQPREFEPLKNNGVEISRLRALPHALKVASTRTGNKKFITISIRSSQFQTPRNSDFQSWIKIAKDIENLGYSVFFIPDFENLVQCLNDIFAAPRCLIDATSDLYLRMAYYAVAKHNFCLSNGTSALLNFSPYPFSMFGIIREGVSNCSADFIKQALGLNPGEKFFWLKENQHFLYSDDSYVKVKRHLDDLIEMGQL
jgi:hypothetical protein